MQNLEKQAWIGDLLGHIGGNAAYTAATQHGNHRNILVHEAIKDAFTGQEVHPTRLRAIASLLGPEAVAAYREAFGIAQKQKQFATQQGIDPKDIQTFAGHASQFTKNVPLLQDYTDALQRGAHLGNEYSGGANTKTLTNTYGPYGAQALNIQGQPVTKQITETNKPTGLFGGLFSKAKEDWNKGQTDKGLGGGTGHVYNYLVNDLMRQKVDSDTYKNQSFLSKLPGQLRALLPAGLAAAVAPWHGSVNTVKDIATSQPELLAKSNIGKGISNWVNDATLNAINRGMQQGLEGKGPSIKDQAWNYLGSAGMGEASDIGRQFAKQNPNLAGTLSRNQDSLSGMYHNYGSKNSQGSANFYQHLEDFINREHAARYGGNLLNRGALNKQLNLPGSNTPNNPQTNRPPVIPQARATTPLKTPWGVQSRASVALH